MNVDFTVDAAGDDVGGVEVEVPVIFWKFIIDGSRGFGNGKVDKKTIQIIFYTELVKI